jgi:hypothetical protein
VPGLAIALLCIAALVGLAAWSLTEWRRGPRALTRSAQVFVPLPPRACTEGVASVLASWPNASTVLHSPEGQTIEVRTRRSARGFGEDVTVTVSGTAGGSLVDVQSAPASWATVIDYGRNRQNVRLVLHAIVGRCGGSIVDGGA